MGKQLTHFPLRHADLPAGGDPDSLSLDASFPARRLWFPAPDFAYLFPVAPGAARRSEFLQNWPAESGSLPPAPEPLPLDAELSSLWRRRVGFTLALLNLLV